MPHLRGWGINISLFETQAKHLQFAGHFYQADKEIFSSLILWCPVGRVQSQKLTCLPWPKWLPGIQDLIPGTWAQLWWIVVFGRNLNVLSTPVVEGWWWWWWWWLYFVTYLLIRSFCVRFSLAMNNQTPQTGFYVAFIVLGRSRKWLKVTSFLGGLGENEYALRCNLVHFETQLWEMLLCVHWPHHVWMIFPI